MMEALILSWALLRSRTLPSLPSLRSPSMKVKKSNSWKYLHTQLHSLSVVTCVLNIPADSHTGLSCSISPRSLLGAVHRLWGPLSGLRLHRLRPVPHGAVLDPEQRAHPARGDHGGAAQHPVLCRSQCGQDGFHQPRWNLLQSHEPVNGDTPVSLQYCEAGQHDYMTVLCGVSTCDGSQCNKPVERMHVVPCFVFRPVSLILNDKDKLVLQRTFNTM